MFIDPSDQQLAIAISRYETRTALPRQHQLTIYPQHLRLALLPRLEPLLLPTTTSELPTANHPRPDSRFPAPERLRLHLLHHQYGGVSVLANSEGAVRGTPPSISRANGALQRPRLRCTCHDSMRDHVLAVLAQTLGMESPLGCHVAWQQSHNRLAFGRSTGHYRYHHDGHCRW